MTKNCEGKTLNEIIQITSSRMSLSDRKKVLRAAVEGVRELNAYVDIASHVSETMRQKTNERWFCFAGAKQAFGNNVKDRVSKYLSFTMSEMTIELFSIADGPKPSTRPEVSRPIRPILDEIPFDKNPQLIESNLDLEDQQRLIEILRKALRNDHNNYDRACQTVLNQLAAKFSFDQTWSCAIGGQYKFSFKSNDDRILTVAFGGVIAQIGKSTKIIGRSTTLRSGYDVITSAQNNINQVSINNTDMNTIMTQNFISLAQQSILQSTSYAEVSKYIRDGAGKLFGKNWDCIVGLDTQFWSHFWYQKPFLINIKVDDLRILAFAQLRT